MNNYYFTFGSSKCYPHQNGYMIIIADSQQEALQAFRNKYPDRQSHLLNCAGYYNEEEWSEILKEGFYKNQGPKEILYGTPALKRELGNFSTLLGLCGIKYSISYGKIILYDSKDNPYCDQYGEIMHFENTLDALNSIDWCFEEIKLSTEISFADNDLEIITNGKDFEKKIKEAGYGKYICHSFEEAEFNKRNKNIVILNDLRQHPDIYLTYKYNGQFGELVCWVEDEFKEDISVYDSALLWIKDLYSRTDKEIDKSIKDDSIPWDFKVYNKNFDYERED